MLSYCRKDKKIHPNVIKKHMIYLSGMKVKPKFDIKVSNLKWEDLGPFFVSL